MQRHLHMLDEAGFAIISPFVPEPLTDALISAIPSPQLFNSFIRGTHRVFAIRRLLHTVPELKPLLSETGIAELARNYFASDVKVIRSIYFNKPEGANWVVPWHQDLTVNVIAQHHTPGFSGWAEKEGQITAKAPVSLLNRILTVRIHLDDCDADNGALKVIPGSHLQGEYRPEQAGDDFTHRAATCAVPKGGIMLMRPLLLHSSTRSNGRQRRVIHLELCSDSLPLPLQWSEAVSL